MILGDPHFRKPPNNNQRVWVLGTAQRIFKKTTISSVCSLACSSDPFPRMAQTVPGPLQIEFHTSQSLMFQINPPELGESSLDYETLAARKCVQCREKKLCITLHLHQIWTRIPDSSGFRRLTKVVLEVIWFFFDVQPAIDGGSTPQDVRYGAPGLIRPSNQLCGGVHNFGPSVGVFGFSKVLEESGSQRFHMLPGVTLWLCNIANWKSANLFCSFNR